MTDLAAYQEATRREAQLRGLANEAARMRARAVANMHSSGLSYRQIAELIGLSRSKAQQLAVRGHGSTRS